MSIQTVIFLLLGIMILILVLINAFLLWRFSRTSKKIDELLDGGKIKNFKDIFLSQKERNDGLEKKIKKAFLKIKNLEEISNITIQKTGVVRFNPFTNMGGNQSFVVAMLDSKNNGFLISSLFVKDGNRVYAKVVKNAKSEHALLAEETEAINKAINSNG